MLLQSLLLIYLLRSCLSITTPSQARQLSDEDQSCLLPYVTEPCRSISKQLFCSFSRNSSERKMTCNLSAHSWFFSTTDFELFLVKKYYERIISNDKYSINKLIFVPMAVNRTYTYSFLLNIHVSSIELPIGSNTFRIIHSLADFIPVRTEDESLRLAWNIKTSSEKQAACQLDVLSSENTTSHKFVCPFDDASVHRCGTVYACLQGQPCFYTGDEQLTCQIHILHSNMVFLSQADTVQYESILLDVLSDDPAVFHELRANAFATKRLIVVISKGILQTTSASFEHRHVRVEHGNCDEGKFLLDIIDDENGSTPVDLIDYTSGQTGDLNCRLNQSE